MPTLTDRQITTERARAIAADWHGGQSSGLYAFTSSGHLNGNALRETWQDFRDVATRGATYPRTSERGAEDTANRRDLAALIRYLRANVYTDVMVCVDCYFVHHYGDSADNLAAMGAERLAEVVLAYDRLGGDQYVTDHTDSNTGDGIETFSWSSCHCCRSGLGGARYRLQVEAQ